MSADSLIHESSRLCQFYGLRLEPLLGGQFNLLHNFQYINRLVIPFSGGLRRSMRRLPVVQGVTDATVQCIIRIRKYGLTPQPPSASWSKIIPITGFTHSLFFFSVTNNRNEFLCAVRTGSLLKNPHSQYREAHNYWERFKYKMTMDG